jgi:hypothetical protein
MSKDAHPSDRPLRWGRWLLLLLLLAPLLGLILHGFWGRGQRRALDRTVAAYKAAGEPTVAEDLQTPYVSDEDNAALGLRAAAGALDTKSVAWQQWEQLDNNWPLSDEERETARRMLAENEKVLAQLDVALEKPAADWQIHPRSPAISLLLPDLAPQRQVARVLSAAAIDAHLRGDDAEALRRILQIRRLARALDQYTHCLVVYLVARNMRSTADDTLFQIAPDLRVPPAAANTLRALQTDLADEKTSADGFRHGMFGERVLQLDTMNEVVSGRLSLAALTSMAGNGPASGGNFSNAATMVTAYLGAPAIVGDTRQMLRIDDAIRTAIDEPTWLDAKAVITSKTAGIFEATASKSHFWFHILCPSFDRAVQTYYRGIADDRLAATILALRAYAADHDGRLPDALSHLVPAYVPSLPADPFDQTGGSLRYRPTEPDPRLYSVGADGIDDGGSDQSTRSQSGRWDRSDAVIHLRQQMPPTTRETKPE